MLLQKKENDWFFSNKTEVVSLDYALQILEADVTNNKIHLVGSVSGIENRGKFETYGYKFSTVESDLDNGNAAEFLINDSLKLDGILDSVVLENLDFNKTYFIRLFGKNDGKLFQSETLAVSVKDGWRRLPGLGIPTIGAFGISSGDKGFVGFGCENEVFLTSQINRELLTFDPADETWNSTGPDIPSFLDFAMASKTVAFEIDGVLYAGTGFGKENQTSFHESRDFYSYDLTENTGWIDLNEPLPDPALVRSAGVSFVLNGKAYVGTGVTDNGGNALNDFYEFDPTRNAGEKWHPVEPMPLKRSSDTEPTLDRAGREGAVAFTANGKGYVGMGRNGGFFFYDFWEFTPNAVPQWKFIGFFPGRSRVGAVAFTIEDNRPFVGTGFHPAVGDLNDFWEFNPATNLWTERTPLPASKRSLAFGFAPADKGYLGGGVGRKLAPGGIMIIPDRLSDFWEYNPTEN